MLDRTVGATVTSGRRLLLGVAIGVALIVSLGAATAAAELTQKGDLFIRFDGGISPRALPRHELAPISLRIEGTVRSPSGERPPSLRGIRIALNRAGRISSQGLPVCGRNQIDPGTSSEALAACGPSLVGAGGIVARTSIADDQSVTTVRGDLLLFNSIQGGRPAILGHIYQTEPTPTTRIVAFTIHRTGGAFGTVITGQIPPAVNNHGFLKSIFLQLERRYVYRGRPRSYLSAACAAPAGFPGATFPFARASMTFEDGRTLSTTLVRSCGVK